MSIACKAQTHNFEAILSAMGIDCPSIFNGI
jgi:hypothetical protein